MANTLRIKRRTSGNAGAPAALQNAELAFNEVDDVLYYGKGTGGANGTATTADAIGGRGAVVMLAGDQTVAGTKTFSSTISGSINGNAATATALQTSRTIAVSGDISGSASFNGSANATIAATLPNVNSNVGTFLKTTVNAKGLVTAATTANLADLSATTADFSMAGFKLTNLGTPTADNDAATKGYVDNLAMGIDAKQSVRAASTGNLTLSGTQSVDGIALIAGDRVLVKNQSTASQNGIYIVAAGAWTRSLDMDAWSEVPGAFTFVEQGTANADTSWLATSDQGGTLNTTAINWVQFGAAASFSAGDGLSLSGNIFNVGTASTARIVVNADTIDLATVGTAGTYRSVTTDAYGRVTAGTNPTTLSGYGITDAQPLDATLTALAGLATAADSVVYATGTDTFATSTLTAFGRSLIDDVDASAARTTLGLVIGTNIQAYDAGLQSIAGLTTAADRMIYTTAADVYAVTTLTAFGRSLIDDVDAAAARTTLGLAIGTNVQAYSAALQSISGLTTAADTLIYTSASNTYATSTLTAFGRSLIDDADAAAGRTTLGLGTIATQAANNVNITGGSITGLTTFDNITLDGGTF
jgi:phage-related tail fiber protein